MVGNESLLTERNELRYHTKDLESELVKVRADAAEDIAALETKIKSAEAHSMDVVATGERHLRDFEHELVKDLAGLCALYVCNIQNIGDLCSPMPESEPSAMDYIRWLSTEVTALPEVFVGVNDNFISATVKGTLLMGRDSIDLATLQTVATDSGADILPTGRDVQKAARAVLKKWWCSFGYDSVLADIQAMFREVIAHV
jgi:hypothetical protein